MFRRLGFGRDLVIFGQNRRGKIVVTKRVLFVTVHSNDKVCHYPEQ